jgi:CheY-like chemotaxis protein
VEGALDLVTSQAAAKAVDLACEVQEDVPRAIVGDATRLRQILLNLLNNAVKFTERGEVVLTVGTALRDDGRHELRFAVRDTGIGIPADRLDRLFQSFSQVDASTTRKYGGTGLGLAISKRLCELMGGAMTVESVPGVGSTFHFTVVAEEAPDSAGTAAHDGRDAAQLELRGRRVLIVDDNETNRRIVARQVASWGMTSRDTGSPEEALRWLGDGERFDAAVLDMQMPEMDGMTLAGTIHEREALGANGASGGMPLILLSSLGSARRDAERAGFAAMLTKPVKPSQLLDALARVCVDPGRKKSTPTERSAQPTLDPGMAERLPLRILLAEDNTVNQKLALRLLERMGYRADVSANGREVLQALEERPYDVVLMDVQMPEMDGLEASRQIAHRWPEHTRPRIIAMTANALQGDREQCLAAGMSDYVSKPIRVDELVSALSKCRVLN